MSIETRIKSLKAGLANGVSPAMATPLKRDSYRVNVAVIPHLVDFLLNRGVKGLFVGGTTGEGILLDTNERKKLHEATIATVDGRVPVLLHIGAQRNDTAVDLAKHAASVQADAVVTIPPYFYGMHDDALAAFFQEIAVAIPDVPLFGYDIPHMAVNGISPDLASRLCELIPSMAGFKSSNISIQAVRRLLDAVPDDRIVLAGNESAALGSLALGADGLISGLSTAVPEPFVAMTKAFADGDMDKARKQQRLINQLLSKIPAGERLGAIKSVLRGRGVPVGTTSPILPQSNPEVWPAMQVILEQ